MSKRSGNIMKAGTVRRCNTNGEHLVTYIHCCGCQKHLPQADLPSSGGFLLCGDCFECDDPGIVDVDYVVIGDKPCHRLGRETVDQVQP